MMNLPSYYNRVIELRNEKFPDKLFTIAISDNAKEAQLFDAYARGIDISYLSVETTLETYRNNGWSVKERKI
jgi:hypothetical protein